MKEFTVINKQILGTGLKRMDLQAQAIAPHVKIGQFIVVVPREGDEWLPLPVIESDGVKGTVTVVIREDSPAREFLGALPIKEEIYAIMGPFGNPLKVEKTGVVLCAAAGIHTAQIWPICRMFKRAGNKVIGVIGAKTKRSLMLEAQMRLACDKLFIATDDGSFERRGTATSVVKEFIDKNKIDLVYTIGPVEMMMDICQYTKQKKIKTRVQLARNILCSTGICGSCRVKVGGKELLACQDGLEFDGHAVDFDYLVKRTKGGKIFDEEPVLAVKEESKVKKFLVEMWGN